MARRVLAVPCSIAKSYVGNSSCFFFFNDPAPTEISPLPLPAALPILRRRAGYATRDPQPPKEECFPRIYKETHPTRKDRVVPHLYALPARNKRTVETKARREY